MLYRTGRRSSQPSAAPAMVAIALSVVSVCLSLAAVTKQAPSAEQTETTQATQAEQTVEPIPAAHIPEPSEATAATTEAQTYTEEELEQLAIVIYQEAGSDACSDSTRMMVGAVVLNRVADERYPDTIGEVLTQRAQYGRLHWTGIKWPERATQEVEAEAVQRAYDCAERLLTGERILPESVVYQAEFIQGEEVVAYQDGLYFCR